jgi:hypothetical protein
MNGGGATIRTQFKLLIPDDSFVRMVTRILGGVKLRLLARNRPAARFRLDTARTIAEDCD